MTIEFDLINIYFVMNTHIHSIPMDFADTKFVHFTHSFLTLQNVTVESQMYIYESKSQMEYVGGNSDLSKYSLQGNLWVIVLYL